MKGNRRDWQKKEKSVQLDESGRDRKYKQKRAGV